jgi:hypothetical protein
VFCATADGVDMGIVNADRRRAAWMVSGVLACAVHPFLPLGALSVAA